MAATAHAVPVVEAAPLSVDALRHRVEMLREQLAILQHLNTAPRVIEVVEQALRDTEEHLHKLQK